MDLRRRRRVREAGRCEDCSGLAKFAALLRKMSICRQKISRPWEISQQSCKVPQRCCERCRRLDKRFPDLGKFRSSLAKFPKTAAKDVDAWTKDFQTLGNFAAVLRSSSY